MYRSPNTPATYDDSVLDQLIMRDQLVSIRRNIMEVMPINSGVSAVALLMAVYYAHGRAGLVWFIAAMAINIIRFVQSWLPDTAPSLPVRQSSFRWLSLTALLSGLVWATLPVLSDYCTNPQTVFYLTITCGITAGAVTHGGPYARVPICFVVPPLLSIFACLIWLNNFGSACLAATVLIYLAALLRSARRAQAEFQETSFLKNQAVRLANSMEETNSASMMVAEQMSYRATHDDLTGLLNRAGFMRQAEAGLREADGPCCLMFIDLDGFKPINEAFGHHAGDRVLVEAARRLALPLGPDCILGRMGGDEFALFYPICSASLPPEQLGRELIEALAPPFFSFDAGLLGACVGFHAGREESVTALLSGADEALRAAKARGRNQLQAFDERLRLRLAMRRDIERDLRRALSEKRAEVWYQPVFRADGYTLVSFEGLLRWQHPQHGFIAPDELIAVAAKTGLAEQLLRFVLDDVCQMIAALRARGLAHVRVAMNISPREIARLAVDEILLAELARMACPAAMLEVEITEETLLDLASVQTKLLRLAEAGVQISIDDFGVGYSTLATLRQPYVNKIKIDRSFVKDIASSRDNQVLVTSILQLGRTLGLRVVAEGVETPQDHALLKQIGCDLVQGYLFRTPAPPAEVLRWLAGDNG